MKRMNTRVKAGIWTKNGLAAALSLGIVSCVAAKPAAIPPAPAQPRREAAVVPQTSPRDMPGLIVTEIEGKRAPERLYSFSLRDADIREVFLALGKQTDFNIVVDPKVKGVVTVDLKNVTLTEALDTLTDLLQLSYAIKQNIIRVFEPVPETRIFSLQYVNVKRGASSSTSATIGPTGGTTVQQGTTGQPGVVGGTITGAVGGGTSTGTTSVNTTSQTDLWTDIDAGVTKLLSPVGKVVVDKQSGNILVTDFPKVLDRIGRFLESIEGSVQRQVLIEARIIEVTLTGEYKFGLDWGALAKVGALDGASKVSPGRIFGQGLSPTASGFQIGVASTDFATLLDVLSRQGELDVISSPKLATLNNQTAVIRAGTDEVFFETRVQEFRSGAGALGQVETTRTVTPRTITIGVVLAITPQISADGSVVLHIRPTVTEKRGEARSPIGDVFPVLDVREADMVVRAIEGQVVVIGGLMQEKKGDGESKVPLLGDLPGIGRLFRGTTQDRRKTELVVLLTPTVLVGKKIDDITAREIDRLNKIKGKSPW